MMFCVKTYENKRKYCDATAGLLNVMSAPVPAHRHKWVKITRLTMGLSLVCWGYTPSMCTIETRITLWDVPIEDEKNGEKINAYY